MWNSGKKIGPYKTQSHLYLKYARSSSIHNFHTNKDKEKLNLQRIQSNSEKICMRISPNEMIIINSRPFLSSYFSLVLCVFFLLYKWSFVITKQVESRRKKTRLKIHQNRMAHWKNRQKHPAPNGFWCSWLFKVFEISKNSRIFFFGKQVAHTRHAHMSVVSYNLYGPRSMYACSIYLLN